VHSIVLRLLRVCRLVSEGGIDLRTQRPNRLSCRYLGLVLAIFLALQCTGKRHNASIRHVTIDSTNSLEVVDWGGSGVPVVFLAGLGHTAHVFDEFAVRLTDNYHVMGITRRGFGALSQPDSGYNIPTLAEDIRIVLDSLGIDRAVLIGHSLGGDEMTLFARKHPQRVVALVYIEAAYNRATARDSMARYVAPESNVPQPSDKDKESAEAYRAYYARVNGVVMPLSEIKAMYRWEPDGRFSGSLTPSFVFDRIIESIRDPDYSGINVPALAIYATDYPVTELFIDYDTRDSVTQRAMRTYHAAALRIDKLSRDYFRTHMAKGRVVEVKSAGHSLYITHAPETLSAIRAFLAEVL
jgi:non-heme chloroperoxidase